MVLGFSWIDDSATGGSYTDNTYLEVYQSEAYTTINGLRLSNAIQDAVAPSFWTTPGSTLHIIGHSHGSKVATVATLDLQLRGLPVNQLTILDSPETELTLTGNGANLLGYTIAELKVYNGSELKFRDVGVFRRTAEGQVEAAWVGDWEPKTAKTLNFQPVGAELRRFGQWDASPTTGPQPPQGGDEADAESHGDRPRVVRRGQESSPAICCDVTRPVWSLARSLSPNFVHDRSTAERV